MYYNLSVVDFNNNLLFSSNTNIIVLIKLLAKYTWYHNNYS